METIYIAIGSCKERYLKQTIESALAAAKYPERLHFGIANTILETADQITDSWMTDNPQISLYQLISKRPTGLGLIKMLAQVASHEVYDYYLQADAHMIFDQNWDELLIDWLNKLEASYGKVVISSETDWWIGKEGDPDICLYNNMDDAVIDPLTFNSSTFPVPARNAAHRYRGSKTEKFNNEGLHRLEQPGEYSEVFAIAASFMFGRHSLITDFMYRPVIAWNPDEFDYAFRLISNGYRIFAVSEPVILGLSKYRDDGTLADSNDWRNFVTDDFLDQINNTDEKRRADMVHGRKTGYWGAPSVEAATDAKNKIGPLVDEIYEDL